MEVGSRALRIARHILGGIQVITAIALLMLIGLVLAGTAPSLMGLESFVVYSGSMQPALGVGDLAVVAPTKPDQLREGDIITYRTSQRPDVVVTHRIVGIGMNELGRFSFQTKGDANNVVDQVGVEPQSVIGRVAYSIPKLGYLVGFAKRPEGRLLLIIVPGVLLAVDYLLGMRRRSRDRVVPAQTEAGELLARGRIALNNGAKHAALSLFDEAIGADPRLEEAWLLKAECLEGADAVACLRAGLTVNPRSASLQRALERSAALTARSSS